MGLRIEKGSIAVLIDEESGLAWGPVWKEIEHFDYAHLYAVLPVRRAKVFLDWCKNVRGVEPQDRRSIESILALVDEFGAFELANLDKIYRYEEDNSDYRLIMQ